MNIDNNDTDIDIDFIDLSSTIYGQDENMKPCSVTECDMSEAEFCCEDNGDISDILSESSNENSETNYSEKDGTVGYYLGGMKQTALDESSKKQIIFASYAMAAEGLDIATLSKFSTIVL